MATPFPTDQMARNAREASALLKALSHEARLMIMCLLMEGERSVTDLERALGRRQAAVSQQLARLRLDGLVRARREGKTIFYSIESEHAKLLMRTMASAFVDGKGDRFDHGAEPDLQAP
jgi:DNA-binding transcriptional ArsR family regulator